MYKIWDNEGKIVYEGYGRKSLEEFCISEKIFFNQIIKSYSNNGEPLNYSKRYGKNNGWVCKKF